MSIFGIVLYLIVLAIAITGLKKSFTQSKKAAIIMLSLSPIYLVIAHFLSPYINWRGKFDGIFSFFVKMGFSHQSAVGARYVFLFILFWAIFFTLSEKNKDQVYL